MEVSVNGVTDWVTGFTGTAAHVKSWDGSYITLTEKTYKQVSLK